jgi:hypothetical protein
LIVEVSRVDRMMPLSGVAFVVLAVVGNAMQGSSPPPHADAKEAAEFYSDKATMISVGMMLSLISLFFLAVLFAVLRQALLRAEGPHGRLANMATGGGVAAVALLAAGFSLNSLGALRARAQGALPPETAAIFYDGSLALTGLAAPVALSILLAPTAILALRSDTLPNWLGWLSAVLAVLGLVTPLSFAVVLLFPLWALAVSVLLYRRDPSSPPVER